MPQAPVHRTPWVVIISVVVVLLVLVVGVGATLALLGGKTSSSVGTVPDQPVPSASPLAFQGPTVSNSVVTVPLLAGWTVPAKDDTSITLADPPALATVFISSGPQDPKMTAQQLKAGLDAALKSKYPDTVECRSLKYTNGSIGGVKGILWRLCFTVVTGGRSLPAEGAMFVGANADGSVGYTVVLITAQTYMQNLTSEAQPVLDGIQWKLR
jgi:hypothetical protein